MTKNMANRLPTRPGLVTTGIFILLFLYVVVPDSVAGGTVKVNQAGYHPNAQKIAVFPVNGQDLSTTSFYVRDNATGDTVYTGSLSGVEMDWEHSGETIRLGLFSAVSEPGTYRITHPDLGSSHPFDIEEHAWQKVAQASLKAFYFNRASMELEESYAGPWARPMGHPDQQAVIHASAATEFRPEGYVFPSPKGWYDAGDYNKYIVNSGISTYTLLAAWEHFPNYYEDLDVAIPESGSEVPDLLQEARWNLDWMMTMQDPHDGGVYHKLTSANFSGTIMPHQDHSTRYAVQKSTAAALNFAAVMATAYRTYKPYDRDFADQALEAAKKAWQWAETNPAQHYRQNQMNQIYSPNIQTGEYGDTNVEDEFDWAATELYIATGNDAYWHTRDLGSMSLITIPSWPQVRPLAWISLAHHRDHLTSVADIEHIEERILHQADQLLDDHNNSAYLMSMGSRGGSDFNWGSNGIALNHSLMLLQGYRLTGNNAFRDAAQANFDYVLGRNPTGYSFVTGIGSQAPMDPHHRQSAADGVADPVPGFVVGGPNPNNMDDCGAGNYPSSLPAKAWLDDWCSYSTNEVAINWNAPLVYVAGAMDAIYQQSEARLRARISAHPVQMLQGTSAEIEWSATGAETVTLDGQEVSHSGTRHVEPSDTTDFILIARSGSEADTARVTVFVVPPEKFNRATGTQVRASSHTGHHLPSNITDGDPETYWRSESDTDEWIDADLDTSFEIERIVLAWGDDYAQEYDVRFSYDGVTWRTVHEERSGEGSVDEIFLDGPENARFVRLHILRSEDDNPVALQEVEVYGTVSVKQPPRVRLLRPVAGAETETGTPVRFIAEVQEGSAELTDVRFVINGDPYEIVTDGPFDTFWESGEPGTYKISAVATDPDFEIQANPVTITVTEVPATVWYDVSLATPGNGAEQLHDDDAREETFVRLGPEGSIRWDDITVGETKNYEIRIGYRLSGDQPADIRLRLPPATEHLATLTGTGGAWYYRDIPDVRLRTGSNTIIINADGRSADVDFLAVRGDGQTLSVSDENGDTPDRFALSQNYPNPFNPATVIRYDLPMANHVRLTVYDLLGRKVAVLADGQMPSGSHEVVFDASRFSSGVYMYRMESGNFIKTRQMMLVK